jgi:hypothetical protein
VLANISFADTTSIALNVPLGARIAERLPSWHDSAYAKARYI